MAGILWDDFENVMPGYDRMVEKLRVSEDDIEDFEEIYARCAEIAHPKWIFRQAHVDRLTDDGAVIEGIEFTGSILPVNLKNTDTVFAHVCTCGRELHDLAMAQNDPLFNYWVLAISEEVLGGARKQAYKRLSSILGTEKLNTMSPGSLSAFPISRQKPLFELIGDVYEKAGVELSDTFLMTPIKSGSGLMYVSDTEFVSCEYCPRTGCPKRRKAYSPGKFEKMFG